jgi:hypothetical protein
MVDSSPFRVAACACANAVVNGVSSEAVPQYAFVQASA